MLDIRLDGQSADLTPGTTLVLERFNPLFDFEQVRGSLVYGFDLPLTPTNRRLLNFFDHNQAPKVTREFRCDKYVYGQLVEQGMVTIREEKTDGVSLFFSQNLNEIFGDWQRLPLSQIDFGSVPTGTITAAANHLTDAVAYPTLENEGFYGNQAVPDFAGRVNHFESGAYRTPARVPMVFLGGLLNRFGTLTGWQFVGEFLDDADLQRLLLYSTYSLDGQTAFRYQNALPDLTMPQLIIALRQLFNLYLTFDTDRRVCRLDFGDAVLASSDVVDWTDRASPQHTKTPVIENRLELAYDLDSNDATTKPIPPDLDKYATPETVLNEGGTLRPVRSRLGTLLTNPVTGRAMTSQPGQSVFNKDSTAKPLPRLLFWNGLVGGEPRATMSQGTRRLSWSGPNSLTARGYSRYEAMLGDTFTLKKLVFLTPLDLATFDFRRKVHIKGVNYWVRTLKAQLGGTAKLVPCDVELWRA